MASEIKEDQTPAKASATSAAVRSTKTIRVLCVDDHPIVRDGVTFALNNEPGMECVGEAVNGVDAIAQYRRLQPDVMLVDLQLPLLSGIEVIHAISTEFPRSRCIVLTTYDNATQALQAIRAGAKGYLLKTMLRKQLIDAIRTVYQGGRHIPVEISDAISTLQPGENLSPRERDILKGVADGLSNIDIATALGISENTVKSHLKTAMAKLQANDRTHAVLLAIRKGSLELGGL